MLNFNSGNTMDQQQQEQHQAGPLDLGRGNQQSRETSQVIQNDAKSNAAASTDLKKTSTSLVDHLMYQNDKATSIPWSTSYSMYSSPTLGVDFNNYSIGTDISSNSLLLGHNFPGTIPNTIDFGNVSNSKFSHFDNNDNIIDRFNNQQMTNNNDRGNMFSQTPTPMAKSHSKELGHSQKQQQQQQQQRQQDEPITTNRSYSSVLHSPVGRISMFDIQQQQQQQHNTGINDSSAGSHGQPANLVLANFKQSHQSPASSSSSSTTLDYRHPHASIHSQGDYPGSLLSRHLSSPYQQQLSASQHHQITTSNKSNFVGLGSGQFDQRPSMSIVDTSGQFVQSQSRVSNDKPLLGGISSGGEVGNAAATTTTSVKRRYKSPFFTGGSAINNDHQLKLNLVFGSHLINSDGSERYSRKVFVGGLPPDIDEEEIKASFRRFGTLLVDWPHKAESKSYFPPKGYAFLLFQEESSVQTLIDACLQEDDKLYLCVSSPTIKDKPVQIRPWRLSDADFVLDSTLALDPRKTVFVGGVPRPLKASELANIMNNLYGGVCYAGIDTDPELKYPKGAGRVAFSNHQSYIAAISARFVHLHHSEIEKRVEVKPYVLDDQFCDECQGARCSNKFAPFFCANVTCLQYYCDNCWTTVHSQQGREFHKPLVKEGSDRPRSMPFRWN